MQQSKESSARNLIVTSIPSIEITIFSTQSLKLGISCWSTLFPLKTTVPIF